MLGDVTDEIKEAWEWAFETCPGPHSRVAILRDALRDQFAARLKAEFWQDYGWIKYPPDTEFDDRQDWIDAQWQAEAERILKGN
jgi:ABC-type nitrate/sulfonate/bicarbonate transport system substrate-binding protein